MPLYVGQDEPTAVYVGDQLVDKVYQGGNQVWPESASGYIAECLNLGAVWLQDGATEVVSSTPLLNTDGDQEVDGIDGVLGYQGAVSINEDHLLSLSPPYTMVVPMYQSGGTTAQDKVFQVTSVTNLHVSAHMAVSSGRIQFRADQGAGRIGQSVINNGPADGWGIMLVYLPSGSAPSCDIWDARTSVWQNRTDTGVSPDDGVNIRVFARQHGRKIAGAAIIPGILSAGQRDALFALLPSIPRS
jgi:hypothetical protein